MPVLVDAAQLITGGIEIELGNQVITVLHTPGHSEDSVCFSFTAVDNQPVLISGDTLFIDGCGRTNDHMITDLYDSIQSLKQLPSETVVLPGHNYGPVPSDTLAHQLRSNRFLLPVTFAGFCAERLGYTVDT
jgi:glyoxylase-like metal-dependent hydrolase (beta-lactamase superfamily II)